MAFNNSEAKELFKAVREYRSAAFAYLGVAHFNHNSIVGATHLYDREFLDKQERAMAQVQKIIKMVEALAEDSVGIAMFAEELVEKQPKLAESLEFVLGVELQEKHRRENAD
jgi:hypothetical protein